MCLIFCFVIFFVWLSVSSRCSASTNQLNGQHLRVIWPRWSGNPKGLSGPLKGGVVLEYLSARLNFTILELHQTGIIDYWDLWFRPMPPQCDGKPKSGNKSAGNNKLSRLSLKNLFGAFVVLLVVLSLSLLAFLCEKIISIMSGTVRDVQTFDEVQIVASESIEEFQEELPQIIEEELPPIIEEDLPPSKANTEESSSITVIEVEEILLS